MKTLGVFILSLVALTLCKAKPSLHQNLESTFLVFPHVREILDISRTQLPALPRNEEQPIAAGYALSNIPFGFFGRHSLQLERASEDFCEWNSDAEKCTLTRSALTGFITQLDGTQHNNLTSTESTVCDSLDSNMSCEANEGCIWDGQACKISTENVEEAGASCSSVTDIVLKFERLQRECSQSFTTKEACNEEAGCVWRDGDIACQIDMWDALIGYPTQPRTGLPAEWTEVIENVNAQVISHALALVSSGGSLDAVLDLNITNVTCPENAEPQFCNLVESSFEVSKVALYCAVKYHGDLEMCTSDERCEADEADGECQHSTAVFIRGFREAFKAVIQDPVIAAVYVELASCALMTSEDSCAAPCVWINGCRAEPQHLINALAQIPSDMDSSACQFVSRLLGSKCRTIDNEEECKDVDLEGGGACQWVSSAGLGCNIDVDALIDSFIAATPVLQQEVEDAEGKCAEADSLDACLAVTP